jgi:hypothetical protein
MTSAERCEVVLETIKHLGWVTDHNGESMFADVIWTMEHVEPADWDCCPLCEEVVCDDGCPLYSVRAGVVFDPQIE